MGWLPTLSHKHIRISLCHERGGCKTERGKNLGKASEIGGRKAAIEDRDTALAAAEFHNQINKIVRAGRDVAGPVRLHGE